MSDHFVLIAASNSAPLRVPDEPAFLRVRRRIPHFTVRAPLVADAVIVAAVRRRAGPRLLVLVPGRTQEDAVRHNGRRALPVNLLQVGDELRIGALDLFVSRQRGQRVAPARDAQVGATCPLCRSPVEAGQRIYTCGCGTVLHRDGEDIDDAERLLCAELASTCPNCNREIDFEEGLEWTPQS